MKAAMREGLAELQALRQNERQDSRLAATLQTLRRWQARRLAATYADLRKQAHLRDALDFFLHDLYGDGNFTDRDRDFERVVPVMMKMLPARILGTVCEVIQLHQLSERLDHAICQCLLDHDLTSEHPQGTQSSGVLRFDTSAYGAAWRKVGENALRARQIELIGEIALSLDRIVSKGFIRTLLRVMHGPAHAAGLASMQGFLERGFAAFHRMGGARDFVATVVEREARIIEALYDGAVQPFAPWVTNQDLEQQVWSA